MEVKEWLESENIKRLIAEIKDKKEFVKSLLDEIYEEKK